MIVYLPAPEQQKLPDYIIIMSKKEPLRVAFHVVNNPYASDEINDFFR
jgi:hypothetical protein